MATTTTYDDLLARVRALASTGDRAPVVGLSGHGGAGKSTLAGRLAGDLGFGRRQVVGTDGFHATTCGPHAGMWEQHDWDRVEAVVAAARAGATRLKARNALQGDEQSELDLWDTKWIPEGHRYEQLERPRERADLLLAAEV